MIAITQSKATWSLFLSKMVAKLEGAFSTALTYGQNTKPANKGSNNNQQVNKNRTTAIERTAVEATGMFI